MIDHATTEYQVLASAAAARASSLINDYYTESMDEE